MPTEKKDKKEKTATKNKATAAKATSARSKTSTVTPKKAASKTAKKPTPKRPAKTASNKKTVTPLANNAADNKAKTKPSARTKAKPVVKPKPKPAAKTTTKSTTKPVAKPATKSATKPAAKTATKSATKPAAKTATKSATKPAAKTATKSATKPAAKTATKSATKPAAKPATKSATRPAAKPTTKSATKPAAKTATKSATKPAAKTATKSATKPAAKSATKTAAKPAATSAAKPATKPTAKPASAPSTSKSSNTSKENAPETTQVNSKPIKSQRNRSNNYHTKPQTSIEPKPEEIASTTPVAPPAPSQSKGQEQQRNKGGKRVSETPKRPNEKPATSGRSQHPNQRQKNPNKSRDSDHDTTKNGDDKVNSGTQEFKLLINADNPEECRVALLEKGKLTAFHVETVVSALQKGSIYKGKVVSVEANLQAAFVDIGTGKNAFLPFSEIHPEYYAREEDQDRHWKDLSMKKVILEGQELLVEVVKEATGNKGANMTTFLSLPGRYVVLLIGSNSKGISRQIDNRGQRNTLREMVESCKLPEGVGYIIRTASKDITKEALTADVTFLINLWQDIKEKGQSLPPASLVYQEQNIVARFLRDHYTQDIQEIMVDSQEAYKQVETFLELLPVDLQKNTRAKLHKGPRPLLNSFNVEEQIEQIYQPTVKLPSGGSIVINPTEALVAIDVNSGRTDKNNNFEETIFLANMEAAEELARQLQLRDLGGLIVVDFIDMRSSAHIREVEKKVKTCMKRDKAKVDFCRISKFGLLQISRQKMAAPVLAGNYKTCEHCQGRGIVKSVETQALVYLRQIQTGVTKRQVKTVHCRLPFEVGSYLLNNKRAELGELERRYKTGIIIETDTNMSPSQAQIQFIKSE